MQPQVPDLLRERQLRGIRRTSPTTTRSWRCSRCSGPRSRCPTPAVQFSGGEPTIHPRFFDIIKAAKELGFAQVQVATNGIEFAKDIEFCQKAQDAGLNTLYLQFDGLRREIYVRARGKNLLDTKKKVIENFRKLPHHPSIVLVPTIVKGVNDDQVWPILHFALENIDVVRGSELPARRLHRAGSTHEELEKGRYTIPDLIHDIDRQSKGMIKRVRLVPRARGRGRSPSW